MQLEQIKASLSHDAPNNDWSPLVQAMWWDAKGDWQRAHEIAQEIESADGSWVHAYLHRKEGDTGNAGYWYRRAQRTMPNGSLQEEWDAIVSELMAN
jgi:hypothetical protein